MEEWRPVVGYEGSYEVSSYGRVRSLDRTVQMSATHGRAAHTSLRKGRMLRPGVMRRGHLCVLIGQSVSVHILVAAAFIGPRPKGLHLRHLNGDPADNRVENLAYGMLGDNLRDRKFHQGWHGRLNIQQVREAKRRLALGEMCKTIASDFGVTLSAISRIKRGATHADITF